MSTPRRPRRAPRTDAAGTADPPAAPPVRSRKPVLSRRRFVSLLAAGSATTLLAPMRAVAAAATGPAKPAAAPAAPPKMRAEIDKQKKSTADALKVIRDFELPPGSVMAFEFRPLERKRGK